MITILEATYQGHTAVTVEIPKSGERINVLEYTTIGSNIKQEIQEFYADPANQHKKVEIVLMSTEDAQRVRRYWQNIHEGGHHA
jgi:hypothetical protein